MARTVWKYGGLGFAGDDADLDVAEAGGFEEVLESGLAEAEPAVGVEFARFFALMLEQVEDGDAPAFFQNEETGAGSELESRSIGYQCSLFSRAHLDPGDW